MSYIEKTLSTQATPIGKYQVLVRVNLTRKIRPRLKTGIYVTKEHFVNGEIVIPKRSKNSQDVKEAMAEKAELDQFCHYIEEVVRVSFKRNRDFSKEWFLSVIDLDRKGLVPKKDGLFTYESLNLAIRKARFGTIGGDELFNDGVLDIITCLDAYCKEKSLASSRTRCFDSMKRVLYRFILFQQMVENRSSFCFNLEELTPEDLKEFRLYILNEGSLVDNFPLIFDKIVQETEKVIPYKRKPTTRKARGLENKSENYAIGIFKKLISVVHWLRDDKSVMENNPFAGIEVGDARYVRRPVYLTISERNKLYQATFDDPMLEQQRDIFIFQCLVGCRYGDLIRLTEANIIDGVLEYVPHKTRKGKLPAQPRVPLSSTASILVEKYRGKDPHGRLFPFINLDDYNKCLKRLFEEIGLVRLVLVYNPKKDIEESKRLCDVVSSHMARRTFIGATYKKTKDPNIVGAMSGHVNGSRAFSRYRDIDDDDLREVISQIE